MLSAITGFIFGIAWLHQQETLPNKTGLCALAAVSAILFLLSFVPVIVSRFTIIKPVLRFIAGLTFGVFWTSVLALHGLSQNLPKALENRDLVIIGTVNGLPQPFEEGTRFQFHVEKASLGKESVSIPENIMLSWGLTYHKSNLQTVPDIQPGQRWQLNVRLKRPHGNANPNGFDYELWLFEQGIRATGYVNNDPRLPVRNALLDSFDSTPMNWVNLIRSKLRERIYRALPECEYAGVIVALVIGDQKAISQSDWEIFNRTGISHLVAISGLHITMISGLFALLAGSLWRRSFFIGKQWPLILPAQKAAAIAGVMMALTYVALAGFGVPARRTLCMIIIVAIALWSGRLTRFSHTLLATAGIVCLFDPWALYKPGFWLSFGAVGTILYATNGRTRIIDENRSRLNRLKQSFRLAARTQWAVTIGLVPLTMLFFGRLSVIGPIANAVAIPLISIVVTPLALVGSILPEPVNACVLSLAHFLTTILVVFLEWLSSFAFAVWTAPAPPFYLIVFAMAGTLWMLAPKGWPHRYLGVLCWLPLFLLEPVHPDYGEAHITVFDVGQGSSILIETQKHRLLFDTGPVYSTDSDAGDRVVLPYLTSRGITSLDTIVVSHTDSDHSGGLLTLMRKLPVREVYSSIAPDSTLAKTLSNHRPCVAGQYWEWEGVHFEMLHPFSDDYLDENSKTNELSCILKVSTSKYSMLFTGDVGKREEEKLVFRHAKKLKSDIVMAPHHGSHSSSTWPFLFAVKPEYAIYQVGYLNPYRHPDDRTENRYDLLGIKTFRTDMDGAVSIHLGDQIDIGLQRKKDVRYWKNQEGFSGKNSGKKMKTEEGL